MSRLLLRQMYGLFWKNVLIKQRNYFSTFVEVAIPIALCLIISWATSLAPSDSSRAGEIVPPTVNSTVDFDSGAFRIMDFVDPPLCYSPNTEVVRTLMLKVQEQFKIVDPWQEHPLVAFKDENEIDGAMLRNASLVRPRTCLVFSDLTALDSINGSLEYKIKSLTQHPTLWVLSPTLGPTWNITDGAFKLQYLVNQAVLTERMNRLKLPLIGTVKILSRRVPYPSYVISNGNTITQLLPQFLVYCFIIVYPFMVNRICSEKASMSREMLKMSGLSSSAYWTSNIAFNLLCFTIVSLVVVTMMKIPFFGPPSFALSNFFVLLLGFMLYSLQLILTGMILSIIVQRPSICTTVAVVYFITSLNLNLLIENRSTKYIAPVGSIKSLCAFPNIAMVLMLQVINKFEGEAAGITWQTFTAEVDRLNGLTYAQILQAMLISNVILCVVLWYLDAVWPWQPGLPKPFYFLFTKSYWMPDSVVPTLSKSIQLTSLDENAHHSRRNSGFFEEDISKEIAIECNNLRKHFSSPLRSEKKVAVNGLHLDIYHGEITCLLGHNGAGKTTTMSMITGLMTPSSGSIRVNGYDLLTETAKARSSMFLCPQHDPLYDELTAREHLYLHACIKGYPSGQIDGEVNWALRLTGMLQHSHKLPNELSGGMKRKLCLAICLVAGSEILILDEPSSGLDTEARRFMWDTLKRIRQNKTILLTTHDMEEADAVADRIVIMHQGRAVCAGSSMFLKSKLGTGYSLSISKSPVFAAAATFGLIKKYLPNASMKVDIGSEITYLLREDSETKHLLRFLFKELEACSESLGINSFGVSVSTLEDVFLKIGEDSEVPVDPVVSSCQSPHLSEISLLAEERLESPRSTGIRLLWGQFIGLLIKRFNHAKRSWKIVTYQIILPCIVFALAFWLTTSTKKASDYFSYPHPIGLDLYPDTKVVLQTDESPLAANFSRYLKQIVEKTDHHIHELRKDENITKFFLSEMDGIFLTRYLKSHVVGLSVKSEGENRSFDAWVNVEATGSFPVALHLIQQTLALEQLKSHPFTAETTDGPIRTSWEMATDRDYLSHSINVGQSISWIIFIPLSVTFLGSSYIVFPVLEKTSKAKLIQLMTGLNPILLHFSSYVFDMTSHCITSVLVISFIWLIDPDYLFASDWANGSVMLLLLMTFGAASISICYLLAYLFTSDFRAFIILSVINVITGSILSFTIFILELLQRRRAIVKSTYDISNTVSLMSPVYSITSGLKKIHDNNAAIQSCASFTPQTLKMLCNTKNLDPFTPVIACCPDICRDDTLGYDLCLYQNPLGWSGNRILPELVALVIVFISFSVLIFIYEFFGSDIVRLFSSLKSTPPRQFSDSDVLEEESRVQHILNTQTYGGEALTVSQLYKKFKNFFAVRGVSFTVHKHECFALLGVNGAGKSTTFGMLTGDLTPARGEVYQQNINLRLQKRKYQQNLGYCPQFNPIIDNLTGSEMIHLFGRLRGIQQAALSLLCDEMITLVDLQEHAMRPSGTYSGGNKRKLSIALAMIGNPNLVLLDEPTAGVDPRARRKIWKSLSYIRDKLNCSMILTLHSMNECEALCSRIAIMVKGEFVCLGSPQHLKSKFGEGYTVTMKIKRVQASNAKYTSSFSSIVNNTLQGATLIDQNDTIFVYRINRSAGSLAQLFDRMEDLRRQLDLEDYTLSDTTLEQVFIQFAKENKSPPQ